MMSLEQSLATFVEVDNELKRVAEEAKLLRKNKSALEEAITLHMVKHEIEEKICTDDSKVKVVKKKTTKSGFTKAGVSECAELLLGVDKARTLMAMIEDKKDVTESFALKRSSTRK